MSLDTGKVDLKVDQGNDCTRALKTTLHSFVPDCNPKSALDGLDISVLVRSAFLSCLIPFIFLFLCSFIPVYSYSCIFLLLYIHIPVYFYSCLFIFLSIFTPVYSYSCLFLLLSVHIPVYFYSCIFFFIYVQLYSCLFLLMSFSFLASGILFYLYSCQLPVLLCPISDSAQVLM